jgi:hypothetical protein
MAALPSSRRAEGETLVCTLAEREHGGLGQHLTFATTK